MEGSPVLFGGNHHFGYNGEGQYAEVRFYDGRFQRYPRGECKKSECNPSTTTPGHRACFRAMAFSQDKSTNLGG